MENRLKKEWVDKIADNYSEEHGWSDTGGSSFYAHATGLSILSLLYFNEGESKQSL